MADLQFQKNCLVPNEVFDLVWDMINFKLYRNKQKKKSKTKNYNFSIPIYFWGKNLETLNFSKILRSIKNIFPNKEVPFIIFNRSKTIGKTIFNYHKVIEEVCVENWKSGNNNMCDCNNPKYDDYRDPYHQHIITGRLKVIENKELISLFSKGPKYREPQNVMKWDHFLTHLKNSLNACIKKWAQKIKKPIITFREWKDSFIKAIVDRIEIIKKKKRFYKKMSFSKKEILLELKLLHEKYVFVPTDKAGNNISIVCKKFYIEQSLRELGIFEKNSLSEANMKTYKIIDRNIDDIIKDHISFTKKHIPNAEFYEKLPSLYWIPKMHKSPTKQRYISASSHCTTKTISAILTKSFKLIQNQHRIICRLYNYEHGIDPMWIIKNSTSVHEKIAPYNRMRNSKSVRTYDFSTLYTSIPLKKLKTQLSWIIKKVFKNSKKKYISVYSNSAAWTNSPKSKTIHMDENTIITLTNWLLDNTFVIFGNSCFRQEIGIPMGTDCAPFIANLFLYAYEFQWIDEQVKNKKFDLLTKFKGCCRYIDDIFLINNNNEMERLKTEIYPCEIKLIQDNSNGLETPFLDLLVKIENSIISTKIFDKRDKFKFHIVNFPVLSGNIPINSSYGVAIGEWVRYARGCTYYNDFKQKSLILISKLKKNFYKLKKLKKFWVKFCLSHHFLILKYGSQILYHYKDWI